MHKKSIRLTILGLVLILTLSGCFSHRFQVQHNPDGSGKLTIETIFTEEYMSIIEDDLFMDDGDEDDIFGESMFTEDDLADSPNILSVTEDSYVDPETNALHHILEIEIANILEPVLFDQEDGEEPLFTIEDQGDGTFLFTVTLEAPSDFIEDEETDDDFMMDQETFRFMLQGSVVAWELQVAEFIESDPQAVYDPANNVVNWEIPMFDVLFGTEAVELYAIYRVDTAEPAEPTEPTEPEPEPEEVLMPPPDTDTEDTEIRPPVDSEFEQPADGVFGLPNWVPIVLVTVLCLGMLFVIVVVVVIFLVSRKRKKDQP